MEAVINGVRMCDVEQTAINSQLSQWWLRKLARNGTIPATQYKNRWWFAPDAVASYQNSIIERAVKSDNLEQLRGI